MQVRTNSLLSSFWAIQVAAKAAFGYNSFASPENRLKPNDGSRWFPE